MILQSLAALARRENLVEDQAFQNVAISWAIELSNNGEFLALRSLKERRGGGKGKEIGLQLSVPRRQVRTSGILADFLVDKPEYVLGIGPDEDTKGKRPARKQAFLDLLRKAAIESPECLSPVITFLESSEQTAKCEAALAERGYLTNDLICFRTADGYLQDVEALKAFWRNQVAKVASTSGGVAQCLVCGAVTKPARLHTQIKGLAGASSSGVPLVSFNNDAFNSYGWDGNGNAAVCDGCAVLYATAINRCLSSEFPDPKHPGEKLPRQAYRLGDDLTAIYWSDSPEDGIEDLLDRILNDPAKVTDLLQAAYTGKPAFKDSANFYCLVLKGQQGRAAVKSYLSEPIPSIRANLMAWQEQADVGAPSILSLLRILSGLAVGGKASRLPENIARELYVAIVFGRRIPISIVALLVARSRAERGVNQARAALLQAWATRLSSGIPERSAFVSLQEDCPSTGYQLGRLLAVCERIQSIKSGGGLNRTVTDRYFGGLSSRPTSVFAQLIRLTKLHLSQIRKRGAGTSYEIRLAGILGRISPAALPAYLTLEEQAMFGLGYYHQRQALFNAGKGPDVAPNPEIIEGEEQQGETH